MGFIKRFYCRDFTFFNFRKSLVSKSFLSNLLFLVWIASLEGCSKSDLERCVDAQLELNKHNLKNNSGVKWESKEKAELSYKKACETFLRSGPTERA